jgi:hypothetical protein
MSQITVDYELDDVTFEGEFYVTTILEAKTYGPPEDCYPAEGGAELENLRVLVSDSAGQGQWFDCKGDNFPDMVERLAELAYEEYCYQNNMGNYS